MRRLILSTLFALCVFGLTNAQGKFWNISDDQFNALGTITEEITVDGLTINANAEATVVVEANNKSLDDYSFSYRMKTGGGGIGGDSDAMPVQRFLKFHVSGNATITMYSMSSSSSATRQVAFSNGTEILAQVDVPGDVLYKQVYEYEGPETDIYIYSMASGLNIYGLGYEESATPADVVSEDIFWNISDDQFNALGSIESEIVVDKLTINGNAESPVVVEANNKSLDDYSFSYRMKTGGGGIGGDSDAMPVQRFLKFRIAGDATITLYSMSSSSSATRQVAFSNGTEILAQVDVPGDVLYKQEYKYEGGETDIYIYSMASGLNIYGLGVTFGTAIKQVEPSNKEVQSVNYYDVTGRVASAETRGIVIVKTVYTDGTTSARKTMRLER